MEASLQVTWESFKITVNNLMEEQANKALSQSKQEVIAIASKDRINSVLHYYLNLAATDYQTDLMEVVDLSGRLLADNRQSYDTAVIKQILFKNPAPAACTSYLTQRGHRIYLVTTTPVFYGNRPVGYLNLGTQVNQKLIGYFSSVLHSELLFFADSRKMAGVGGFKTIPRQLLFQLKQQPDSPVFLPGNQAGVADFDYILFTLPTDGGFTGVVAIAKSRAGIQAGLLRLKLFLLILTGISFIFGIIGTHSLARNIKKSIFGMEPQEIASLLTQRTAILQSTFEGIIALDQTGRIILINKEAERFFPHDNEVIGQPAVNFLSDLKIQEVLETGKAVYNQQQVIGETVIVYNCIPMKVKNSILGAVITLRDLTEFQRVAAELMEVKNYTQALRAQSHEFMNKLQSVSGLIQLGQYETALSLLHETTESHQEMVSYLAQTFSNSAVSGILLGKFNRAKELNIHFEIDRTSYIPHSACLPDHELVCIVGNLIENAFESLQMANQSSKNVVIRLRPVSRYLQITVLDNGPGIPESIRKVIFNQGFTSKKGVNKGIGLSLVKQYVENLHGSIRFHSNKNFTVFWVRIPLFEGRTNT